MKKSLSFLLAYALLAILFSCDKDDNNNCSECEGIEITVCDLGDGKAIAKMNGEEFEVTYNDGSDWDLVVSIVCQQLSEPASGCYECDGPNVEAFDVCKTDKGITVNGVLIEDTETVSLEDAVAALEANEDNEEVLENLACKKK